MKIDDDFSLVIGSLDDDVVIEYDRQQSLRNFSKVLLDVNYPYRGFSDLLESETFSEHRDRFLFYDRVPRVYQYRLDPPSFMISPRFERIEQVVRELDLPTHPLDKYFSRLWRAGDFVAAIGRTYREYQKYTVETLGLRIDSVPFSDLYLDSHLPTPNLPRYWLTSNKELIQIWRVRVLPRPLESFEANPDRPVTLDLPHFRFVEERWHPVRLGSTLLGGLHREGVHPSRQMATFHSSAKRILAGQNRNLDAPWAAKNTQRKSF